MEKRQAVEIGVHVHGGLMHEAADGEVRQQEPVAFLPDQIGRLCSTGRPARRLAHQLMGTTEQLDLLDAGSPAPGRLVSGSMACVSNSAAASAMCGSPGRCGGCWGRSHRWALPSAESRGDGPPARRPTTTERRAGAGTQRCRAWRQRLNRQVNCSYRARTIVASERIDPQSDVIAWKGLIPPRVGSPLFAERGRPLVEGNREPAEDACWRRPNG